MSAKKSNTPSESAGLLSLLSWLLGPGRPVLILAVLFGLFGGGAYWAWLKYKTQILDSPEYQVGPQQVEITPPPEWIHSDIRAEVFRDPALGGPLSLMDDNLTQRIARAFAQCPWVAKVERVAKRHPSSSNPASVKVDLIYRKPVCMVVVPLGLLPVDAEGTLLPGEGDFTSIEATRYPRLEGVKRNPTGPVGSRWMDAAVIGGAEIAAAIGPAWEALGLHRIVPLAGDLAGSAGGEPTFAIFTHGGTQIIWGHAPGANVIGELSAKEKVARLQRYLANHDTLEGREGQRQNLDVRTLPAQ